MKKEILISAGCLLGLLLLFLSGCGSSGNSTTANTASVDAIPPAVSYALRPGDQINVELEGIPDPITQGFQINERGTITLRFIGAIQAEGKTPGQLENDIQEAYVSGGYYNNIDVNVFVQERYVTVGGQVNRGGRVPWIAGMRLSEAIQAAGGFSVFADRRDIILKRNGQLYRVDGVEAERNPSRNYALAPGDEIIVDKSAL